MGYMLPRSHEIIHERSERAVAPLAYCTGAQPRHICMCIYLYQQCVNYAVFFLFGGGSRYKSVRFEAT